MEKGSKKRIIIESMLVAFVILSQLYMASEKCADSFCADDSFYYRYILDHEAYGMISSPQAGSFPMLAFAPMIALKPLFGSVMAIRISAALVSAIFFLAFSRLLLMLTGRRAFSYAMAFLSTLSFWWMRLSFGLYKNELAIALIVLFALFFIKHQSGEKGRRNDLLICAAILALLAITHITSLFLLAAALAAYFATHHAQNKQLQWSLASAAVFALLLAFAPSLLPIAFEDPSASGKILEYALPYYAAFAAAIPFFIISILWISKKHSHAAMLLSSFIIAGALLSLPLFAPAEWGWRFLFSTQWAIMASVFAGMAHVDSFVIGQFHKKAIYCASIILLLSLAILANIAVSAAFLIASESQLTHGEEALLREDISRLSPSYIFISPKALTSGFGSIGVVLMHNGYSGPTGIGECKNSGNPQGSTMLYYLKINPENLGLSEDELLLAKGQGRAFLLRPCN